MVRSNCVQIQIHPSAPLNQRINLELVAKKLSKRIANGYIVFKFSEFTFKLTRNYQITVFVKKDIQTLENLHESVYYFVKYIYFHSGVGISNFYSKVRRFRYPLPV